MVGAEIHGELSQADSSPTIGFAILDHQLIFNGVWETAGIGRTEVTFFQSSRLDQ
jgi:hypothetical protein